MRKPRGKLSRGAARGFTAPGEQELCACSTRHAKSFASKKQPNPLSGYGNAPEADVYRPRPAKDKADVYRPRPAKDRSGRLSSATNERQKRTCIVRDQRKTKADVCRPRPMKGKSGRSSSATDERQSGRLSSA